MVPEKYIGYSKNDGKYVPIYKQKQLSYDDISKSYFDGYEIQEVPGAMKVLESNTLCTLFRKCRCILG